MRQGLMSMLSENTYAVRATIVASAGERVKEEVCVVSQFRCKSGKKTVHSIGLQECEQLHA